MEFSNLLGTVFYFPMIIALVVGVVLTAKARREHGSAATIGLFGCLMLLADQVLGLVWAVLLPVFAGEMGYRNIGVFLSAFGLLRMILGTVGISLLIWAVVARRGQRPPPAPAWQPPPGH